MLEKLENLEKLEKVPFFKNMLEKLENIYLLIYVCWKNWTIFFKISDTVV